MMREDWEERLNQFCHVHDDWETLSACHSRIGDYSVRDLREKARVRRQDMYEALISDMCLVSAERDRLREALSGFIRCIAVTAVGPAWVRQDGTHYPLPGEALRVFRAAIAALEDQPTGEGDDMACNR